MKRVLFPTFVFAALLMTMPSLGHAESSFYRLKSMIQSLDVAQDARDTFYQGLEDYSEKKRASEFQRAIYKALNKVSRAKNDINRYDSSGSRLTQKSNVLFNRSYEKMEKALNELNELMRESSEREGGFGYRLRRHAVAFNQIGKDLHNAVALEIYASVDESKKNKRGQWTHVKMSRPEYRQLNEMVVSKFVTEKSTAYERDDEPVKSALVVVWQFLDSNWKAQGESAEDEDAKYNPNRVELFNKNQLIKLNALNETT